MSTEFRVGDVIAERWRIEAVLHRHAWHPVHGWDNAYKVRHVHIDRPAVLRRLHPALHADSGWCDRFFAACRACFRLANMHTARLFEIGEVGGEPYLLREFVDGVPLDDLSIRVLAPKRAIDIVTQCCSALAEAHAQRVVHGGIKSSNLFLMDDGRRADFVKVTDFSISALEYQYMRTFRGVGAPAFTSPEQASGLAPDTRSDVYSLGIVAYCMLTGHVPFIANFSGDERRHLTQPVPPMASSIPESVQRIVLRALEKDPGKRYQSADEMKEACRKVLAELTGRSVLVDDGPELGPSTRVPVSTGRDTGVVSIAARGQGAPQGYMPQGSDPAPKSPVSRIVSAGVIGVAGVAALIQSYWGGGAGVSEGGMITVGVIGAGAAGALGFKPITSAVSGVVRRSRDAVAERTGRRALERSNADTGSVETVTPPHAIAYRPSWVLPRRQSAIHVYVVVAEALRRLRKEARRALAAPGNPALGSPSVSLWRSLEDGERLAIEVELEGFDVREVEPIAWRPPWVRFVVGIRARADIALGVHHPIVTVRAEKLREVLTRLDFYLEVRESGPRVSLWRAAMVAGCAIGASGVAVATTQNSVPPSVGWPVSAVCVAGGASTWAIRRTEMVAAEARDRRSIFVSSAEEDRERVMRAIRMLQEKGRFPVGDVQEMAARQPIDAIERADRVFVFWSERARASSEVAREWKAAVERAGAVGDRARFVAPIVLGQDRLEDGHPLARFDSVDLGAMVDALIVTALPLEYEAVLAVDGGAVPGSGWQRRVGPARLEVAFREFAVEGGKLRIAVTQALGTGGVSAVAASARLIDACFVRCLAMCGVCAGRRGDVELGDVIIADRLWQYDAGKRKVAIDAEGEKTVTERGDIDMYKIQPPEWKQAAERFQIEADAPWLAARPASQGDRARPRIHVGPIASGNKVMEDAEVFPLLADSVRKVLGVEMEAAAIGALANAAQLPFSVVMKAVMDHADANKSDSVKAFAARASAECLMAFLRANLPPRDPPIP